MSYVRTKNPGGKIPGRGWAPGLRGVSKRVFGGLGCACKKTLGGVEDSDLYTGDGADTFIGPLPPDLSTSNGEWVSSNNPFALPGLNAGLTPGSGQAASSYPSSPIPGFPNLSTVPGAIAGSVFNSSTGQMQPSPSSTGLVIGNAASSLGLSNTTLILGGVALFAVVSLLASRRR